MTLKQILNPIIIFGSSRSIGNTSRAVDQVLNFLPRNTVFVDLKSCNISYFDYEHKNRNDDFIPLAERMITHNPIILATPVYWYMPSAAMKIFIDRISDLLTIRKDIGRQLRGKSLSIITSYSVHPEGKAGFEQIFQQISEYLGMEYCGIYSYYSGDDTEMLSDNAINACAFAKRLIDVTSTD